jgi:hypothetical protein
MNPSNSHFTVVDPWELHLLLIELKDWELLADHHMHKSTQFQSCQQALQWHALAQAFSELHGHNCLFYLGNVGSGRIDIDIINPIQGHLVRTDLDTAVKLNALERAVKILPPVPCNRSAEDIRSPSAFLSLYHSEKGSMATCDLPTSGVDHPSAAALHQLKELLQSDPAFAQALCACASTEDAARLAAEHGVQVSPEALWRHRGTLVSGGLPTWRG